MQNYLFNIVVQINLWTISTFSFRQEIAVLISSGFGSGLSFLSEYTIVSYCYKKKKKMYVVF